MIYRQYLENIREDICNFELEELQSKHFLDILRRVHEIEDLSYIDIVLKSAGLDISFIDNKDFLYKKVQVKSKLSNIYIENNTEVNEDMQDALSEYLSQFTSKEDAVLLKLNSILGEDGIEEVSAEYFPDSEEEICSTSELIDKNRDTLSALFGGLSSLNKPKEIEQKTEKETDLEGIEKKQDIPEKDIQIENFESLEDVSEKVKVETIEEIVDLDESKEIKKIESLEEVEEKSQRVEIYKEDYDDDFESIEDFQKSEDIDDSFNLEEEQFEDKKYENKDFSLFLDTDIDEDEQDEVQNDDFEEDDFSLQLENQKDIDKDNDIENKVPLIEGIEYLEDTTDKELAKELSDEDLFEDDDIESKNLFVGATEYFLNGGKKPKSQSGIEDLKELARKKERIINSKEVSSVDDTLAKMLLTLGTSVMSLPNATGNFFRKLKDGSKKMRETMIVEDEEDGEDGEN